MGPNCDLPRRAVVEALPSLVRLAFFGAPSAAFAMSGGRRRRGGDRLHQSEARPCPVSTASKSLVPQGALLRAALSPAGPHPQPSHHPCRGFRFRGFGPKSSLISEVLGQVRPGRKGDFYLLPLSGRGGVVQHDLPWPEKRNHPSPSATIAPMIAPEAAACARSSPPSERESQRRHSPDARGAGRSVGPAIAQARAERAFS